MEITFSKRLLLVTIMLLLGIASGILALPRLSGRSLAQIAGLDSGQSAALSGAEAFYSIDYQAGPDKWGARLCALSTEPACDYFTHTLAPHLWPDFVAHRSTVVAKAGGAVRLAELTAGSREDAPMQVWRVDISLSQSWPQGDGDTTFPAYVLVVRAARGWRFERFLLPDEISRYTGGEQ
jgi:hypothetical protein